MRLLRGVDGLPRPPVTHHSVTNPVLVETHSCVDPRHVFAATTYAEADDAHLEPTSSVFAHKRSTPITLPTADVLLWSVTVVAMSPEQSIPLVADNPNLTLS